MICSFKEFTNEGLIQSVPQDEVIKILSKNFDFLNIEKTVVIRLSPKNGGDILPFIPQIEPFINNLGWFISTKIISDNNVKTVFLNTIKIEPKYNTESNKIPDNLYHITDVKNLDKIKKMGIVPKSKNKISLHPSRIYLTYLDQTKWLSKIFKKNHQMDPIVIKIDTYHLYKDRKIKLYIDPRMQDAYYTYDNIPPDYFEEIITL